MIRQQRKITMQNSCLSATVCVQINQYAVQNAAMSMPVASCSMSVHIAEARVILHKFELCVRIMSMY